MTSVVSHSNLVPREHVHRDALSEVYLTDIICDRSPNFLIGVQLPKSHSYYSDHIGDSALYYDPLLLLECFRQASILIAHRHAEADYEQAFVFNTGAFMIQSYEALRIISLPANGVLSAVILNEKIRDSRVVGLTLEMTFNLHSNVAASMQMTIQWMPRSVLNSIRDRGRSELSLEKFYPGIEIQINRRPTSIPNKFRAENLCRRFDRNVVIGNISSVDSNGFEVDLLVDQNHPSLFDHPLDHIPGALLFEAIRQAGIIGADNYHGFNPQRLLIHKLNAQFLCFGELDLHTSARVRCFVGEETEEISFVVDICQEERIITTGYISFVRNKSLWTVK